MQDLQGRRAIVTGASAGIGAAVARTLAAYGVHVALAARNSEPLEALAAALRADHGVNALAVPIDVSRQTEVHALVEQTLSAFGGLDILINCAGVGIYGRIAEVDADALRQAFAVNVFGPLFTIQAVTPPMRRNGGGIIVNVNSTAGRVVRPQLSQTSGASGGYAATKFALSALTQAARAELSVDNIAVISIYPGRTRTHFGMHVLAGSRGFERPTQPPAWDRWSVPPEAVAQRIVKAIQRGEREVYVTWWDRAFVLAAHWFPALYDWALRRAVHARYRS